MAEDRQFLAESHGDRQTYDALSQATPGSSSPQGSGAGPGGQPPSPTGAPGPAPSAVADVFAPMDSPSPQAPTRPDPQFFGDDPDMLLRVLYANYPHPDLLRLIRRRGA